MANRKAEILIALALCAVITTALPLQPEDEEEDTDNMINSEGGDEELFDYLASLLTDEKSELPLVYLPEKRSRYYRRYPWKRQNGRNYDPDAYLCTPSRQDVFHLLLALHDARSGNLDRQVHFCNRRRPARAIFTNIRFLGRRR